MKLRLWSIEGNRQMLDGGAMFGNAPRSVWEKWIQPDEQGRIPLACRCLLVEAGGLRILCETGIGAFFEPKLAQRYGVQTPERHRLLESLKAAGFEASDIDYVILSHLHFDHAGGLLPVYQEGAAPADSLVFPKAKFVVGKEAFERAKSPHPRDRASFIPGLVDLLENSGRLILIERDHKLPGTESFLDFFWTDGHTPGQMHTRIRSSVSEIIYAGDLIPGRFWVHQPITMGYDRYPEKLIDEKRQLYEEIKTHSAWVFFTHDHEVSCAQIQKSESGKFIPVHEQVTLEAFELK